MADADASTGAADSARAVGLPSYDELPVRAGAPEGSSWGLWGPEDRLGCLNLLSGPEQVRRAAALVRRGAVFPLDWDLSLPDPPYFGRGALRHRVDGDPGATQDDVLDGFNPQSSSQWDGFRHFGTGGRKYNGLASDAHGVDHWARRGIVGRAVLVDVAGWRRRRGDPLEMTASVAVGPDDLRAVLAEQGSAVEPGDVLLVHFGWTQWYLSLDRPRREKLATLRAPRCPGLRAGRDMVATLWDLHVAAVAADTPTMEVSPFGAGLAAEEQGGRYGSLHQHLLPLLGMPIGELWDLRALAADCEADGVYECMLSSAPLQLRAGVASPPNAIAIK